MGREEREEVDREESNETSMSWMEESVLADARICLDLE